MRFRWYVRALTLVALLGPLLLAPAFDLWSIFVVQSITMMSAFAVLRGVRAWRSAGFSGWTFQLMDALAVTLYVALLAAAFAAEDERRLFFLSYATRFGVGFALLGLLGVWLAAPPARWWGYVARGFSLLALPILTVALLDFSPHITRNAYPYPYFYYWHSTALTWAAPLVIAIAVRGLGMLGDAARPVARAPWRSACVRASGMISAALILLGVVVGYVAILDDPGLPQEPMPSPNGYDELNRAIAGFEEYLPYNSAWQATDTELARFLEQTATVRSAARQALQLPSVIRLGDDDYFYIDGRFSERRKLAWAWAAEAVAASRRGDVSGMIDPCLSTLQLAKDTWNGGIDVNMFVAVGIVGTDVGTLRNAPSWPDDPRLQPLLNPLLEWDPDLESSEAVVARSRLCDRHVSWRSRLQWFLSGASDERDGRDLFQGTLTIAQVRLLALELALARYRALHGDNPETLEQLVPEVLPAVPRDPFAEDRPLTYQRQANAYWLYSVGGDGVDNGGNYNWLETSLGHEGYDYRLP